MNEKRVVLLGLAALSVISFFFFTFFSMKAQEEADDISIINVVPKSNTISKPDTTIQIPSFFSSKVQESASV